MFKGKGTKYAFISSLLVLVFCVATLVGTTYAWFTDSVSTARNVIQSGNLDVQLWYSASANGPWTEVDDTTDIFGYNEWEPGHTKVAYFKIVNNGSLALTYTLSADVYTELPGTNKAEESFLLSNSLMAAVVEAGVSRTDILAASGTPLKDSLVMKTGTILAGGEDVIVGFAIWMPTTVGNEANHNGTNKPSIEFAVNLIATQKDVEGDSFGSDYDRISSSPVVTLPAVPADVKLASGTSNSVSVDLPASFISALSGTSVESVQLVHSEPKVDTTSGTPTIVFSSIEIVDQDGNIIDLENLSVSEPITVKLPAQTVIAPAQTVAIYHDGVFVTNATVAADGTISYDVAHLCEVTVLPLVTTEDELKNAVADGGLVMLGSDITVTSTVTVPNGQSVVLNLNGFDINYAVSNTGASAIIVNNGTLDICGNGTLSFVADNPDLQSIPHYATNTITNEGTLTIGEGVTVTNGSQGGASYAVDNKGVFTLNGGTLTADRCALRIAKYNQDNVKFVMNGGTVTAATPAWIQLPGSSASAAPTITVVINDGTFETTKESSADNDVLYTYSFGNSNANTSVTINGGNFIGGTLSIGTGYYGDVPSLTINGGNFDYDVLQWLEDGSSTSLYSANN